MEEKIKEKVLKDENKIAKISFVIGMIAFAIFLFFILPNLLK